MKHFNFNFLLILSILFLVSISCQHKNKEKVIFEKSFYFQKKSWNRFQKDSIEFNIKDTHSEYDIIAEIEHEKIQDMNVLPISISIYAPDQSFSSFATSIALTNKDGKYIGKDNNSFITVNQNIISKRVFQEAGTYKIVFNQRTSKYNIIGVKSLKLKVVKKDLNSR